MGLNPKYDKKFTFTRNLGKFIITRKSEFHTAGDAYIYYGQLTQARGGAAQKIIELEAQMDIYHKQMTDIDEELKLMGVHAPEMLAANKKEVEAKRKTRAKDIEKGVTAKPMMDPNASREEIDPKDIPKEEKEPSAPSEESKESPPISQETANKEAEAEKADNAETA